MKSLENWFEEYSADHQNKLNRKIHLVCVPTILFSIIGLLTALPEFTIHSVSINWVFLLIIPASIFYFLLSLKYGILMFVITMSMFGLNLALLKSGVSIFSINLGIFILAWFGQFYGHKVEGKRPSFLKDLTYLLIGPLWVLKKLKI